MMSWGDSRFWIVNCVNAFFKIKMSTLKKAVKRGQRWGATQRRLWNITAKSSGVIPLFFFVGYSQADKWGRVTTAFRQPVCPQRKSQIVHTQVPNHGRTSSTFLKSLGRSWNFYNVILCRDLQSSSYFHYYIWYAFSIYEDEYWCRDIKILFSIMWRKFIEYVFFNFDK